jgi:hypothetical protein
MILNALNGFQKTIAAAVVVLAVGLGIMLTLAQVTQERALERARADVTRCFLSPGRLLPAQVRYCESRFDDPSTPGNDYQQVQADTARNLAAFRTLIGDVETDSQRLADLELKVQRIENGGE